MAAGPATTGSRRSLVLGAYANLPVRFLEPFARSLRATGFQGRFHLVTAGYDPAGNRALGELADHVRPVDDEYRASSPRITRALRYARRRRGLRRHYPRLFEAVARTTSEQASLERWRNLEFQLEGLQSLRYRHYQQCILEDAPDADLVLITDVRDVVFQRDPFADPVAGLELYLEDASAPIGVEPFTTSWLRDLYGEEMVQDWSGRPISCSGTVVGTRAAMLAYLSEMIAGIVWRRRPMGAHDQGVHNGLIQTGRLPFAKIVPNETGRILTVGMMANPRVNDDGLLENADGSIPAVVHQWDRHPSLASTLLALQATRPE